MNRPCVLLSLVLLLVGGWSQTVNSYPAHLKCSEILVEASRVSQPYYPLRRGIPDRREGAGTR